MGRRWRWVVVAAVTAIFVSLPLAAQLLPAGHSTVSAARLLARVKSSAAVAYSGYAQSSGGLALPSTAAGLNDISDLFGGTNRLRVWWRASDDWRVDSIDVTGESDVHHDASGTWTWDYESDTARRTTEAPVPLFRLPRADDLVPASLARRLLSQVAPAQVTRLPNERIAGEQAAGLRVTLSAARSTITHIDVWALPSNGLPVQVRVYGGSSTPLVSTSLLDLSLGAPSAGTTTFTPPAGAHVEDGLLPVGTNGFDRFAATTRPPRRLAGLDRRRVGLGAVALYGRGVTLLVAVPLSAHLAGELVPQLRMAPGAVEDDSGIAVSSGVINLQLSPPSGFGARWLLVGTVTAATLLAAVPGLPRVNDFDFHDGRFGR